MFGIDEALKQLLHEVKGMRHDLNAKLGELNTEVKKINENLEAIRDENHERFELLHPEPAKKLPKRKHGHESRHR